MNTYMAMIHIVINSAPNPTNFSDECKTHNALYKWRSKHNSIQSMTLFNIKSLSADDGLWVQCANNKLGGGKMHPASANALQQLGCVNIAPPAAAAQTLKATGSKQGLTHPLPNFQ